MEHQEYKWNSWKILKLLLFHGKVRNPDSFSNRCGSVVSVTRLSTLCKPHNIALDSIYNTFQILLLIPFTIHFKPPTLLSTTNTKCFGQLFQFDPLTKSAIPLPKSTYQSFIRLRQNPANSRSSNLNSNTISVINQWKRLSWEWERDVIYDSHQSRALPKKKVPINLCVIKYICKYV